MTAKLHRESIYEPFYLSQRDALIMLGDVEIELEEEIAFQKDGEWLEHERTLVSMPVGDEIYTGKPAAVWVERMEASYMPLGVLAVVYPIRNEVNQVTGE